MNRSAAPRVLVVNGEPFNGTTATGITISNLFKGWPHDRLMQIYTAGLEPDFAVCSRFCRLTPKDLAPMAWFYKKGRGGVVRVSNSTVSSQGIHKAAPSAPRGFRKLIVPALDLLPLTPPATVHAAVREFRPEIIYSLLGNIRLVRLVVDLSDRYELPVVPHFMDDWISTYAVPGKSYGSAIHKRVLRRALKTLFERVPVGMAIGDAMASEYENTFQRRFFGFMNPVDVEPASGQLCRENVSPLRFVYTGGLHLGRASALEKIGAALGMLEDEGIYAELHLYVPKHDEDVAISLVERESAIRFGGSLPPDRVHEVLRTFDVAVHVESFDSSDSAYTRLSVSTKIPQYFAAGLPVFAYGPRNLASCRYVCENRCGIVVGSPQLEDILVSLREITSDATFRQLLGEAAWERAYEFHRSDLVRSHFRQVLAAAHEHGVSSRVSHEWSFVD